MFGNSAIICEKLQFHAWSITPSATLSASPYSFADEAASSSAVEVSTTSDFAYAVRFDQSDNGVDNVINAAKVTLATFLNSFFLISHFLSIFFAVILNQCHIMPHIDKATHCYPHSTSNNSYYIKFSIFYTNCQQQTPLETFPICILLYSVYHPLYLLCKFTKYTQLFSILYNQNKQLQS